MVVCGSMTYTPCHCEEDDSPTRQSTACNGGDRVLQYARGSQSIATGLRPRDEKRCRANSKKLGFFFFWGTRGFTVAHKENLGIALTFIEGDNRINTSDHIAPNADCNCPHQCHSRATFPIPNPADKEKESDINIKQGNNSPWIIQ